MAGALDVLEALAAGAFQPPPRDADQAARDEHAADADDTESSEQARAKEPSHSTVNP